MNGYDVVVVGGGIGGLTVAALLSARGLKTCLLERQSQVGGCVARVEFSGYDFEPGEGLYTSFGPGGVYERLFAQLRVDAPTTSLIRSPYMLRHADGSDTIIPADDFYSIAGGPASVAERLAESIKRSGGKLRLDTPVLRLAYDEQGSATGVDLLSGERVFANQAIISNLTIWDTYGKLVGLNRTPPEIKKQLNSLRGAGIYVIYAVMEEPAVTRLPALRMRVEDSAGQFTMAVTQGAAPDGKYPVTFTTETDVDSWFTYQSSEEDYDEWDQAALTEFWQRVHAALPELGGDIEIIETANPRTYYDQTRRKLGMVHGIEGQPIRTYETSLPNLFIVGDTVSSAARLDRVVESAVLLADQIKR
ncbi:MAG TPA: FAD-dependent oxidoreductase [Pyrinomonadaceae bacterium]|nr:FAD-dependent oxidoreductase [Pyrinomonadaceae bacterium]